MCFYMCLTFFPYLSFNAKYREIFYSLMDKETLIKIAQPAATTFLALAIIAYPLIVNASGFPVISGSIYVTHRNSCAN